jgi:Tfp pilus assembly protein PilF
MKKLIKWIYLVILLVTISACANKDAYENSTHLNVSIPINNMLFSDAQKVTDTYDDIFKLTPSQQNTILSLVQEKQAKGMKLYKALEAVIKTNLNHFTYYGETYNASTAMKLNKGNCMSLAVLTTAYAKLFDLELSYREVNTIPVFEKKDDVTLSSSHVQTIIYDADFVEDKNSIYINKPSIIIDYFPSKSNRVGKLFDEATFTSMYYRNLAADALVEDDLEKAFMLAVKAYNYNKQNIEVINLLAVIHRRADDNKGAENIYKAGLQIEQSSLALISNYIMLLRKQQRYSEAKIYQEQLDQLDDPNPYHWLEQAYAAQHKNKTRKAILYYKKAIHRAPYLKEAYLGLYDIYRKKDQLANARIMLKKALEWTYEIEHRKQYKQKLYSLAQL